MKTKKTNQESLLDIFPNELINNNNNLINLSSSIHYDAIDEINSLVVFTGDTEYNGLKELANLPLNYKLSNKSIIDLSPIHYDAISQTPQILEEIRDVEELDEIKLANLPLFFEQSNKIYIPTKVERVIERYIPKKKLREINEDLDVAKELCLIFLSNLSNAFYQNKGGWKTLQAKELRQQVGTKYSKTYQLIIDVLIEGTKNGSIIERNKQFTIGQESRRYRLTDNYRDKGIVTYELKTEFAKNLRRKTYFKILNNSLDNIIANNLIKIYSNIDIPTVEEIKKEAKRLVKEGYITKKGKKLTFLNKHSKDYFTDYENRSFVEDNIKLFLRLTENGFLIPMVGGLKNGGRVTDSFTLMPSWIRNMCKIDGKRIEEVDYSALHPNIAIKIYGGRSEYITHDKVANISGIDKKEVKIEHLSFFNKKWDGMVRSKLFEYYSKQEPELMQKIFTDKDMFGHKITSKKMFKMEVDIMTSVIKKLNDMNIYVGYVYDALFCSPKNKSLVLKVMNEEIINFGVKTVAK